MRSNVHGTTQQVGYAWLLLVSSSSVGSLHNAESLMELTSHTVTRKDRTDGPQLQPLAQHK